jgi:protease-4
MLRLLKKAEKDSSIKAVVLRLDSPGGAVPPSQEIYGAVKAFQKPVIVSMGNVAASGAFYIAMGAKSIYANPGTLTGSVGVILSMMNLQKLFEWAKIEPVVVKSGKFKDVPSPNRPMTAEERAYLQATIDEVQGQFRAAVKEGRKLTDADLDRFADGRVMTGSQALRLKLVDKLGGIQEAIVEAGKIAGIEGDPHVVYPQRKRERLLDLLTEFRPDDEDEDGEASTKGLQGLQQPLQALTDRMTTGLRPGLYWLWDGGL